MQRLVAVITAVFVEFWKVVFCVDLLPVGEKVGVSDGAVDLVGVEDDYVRAWGDTDQGSAASFDQTPGPRHSNQVSPRVKHIAVSENYR